MYDASRSEGIRFFSTRFGSFLGRFGCRIVWGRVYDLEGSVHAIDPSALWIIHPSETSYDLTRKNRIQLQVKRKRTCGLNGTGSPRSPFSESS